MRLAMLRSRDKAPLSEGVDTSLTRGRSLRWAEPDGFQQRRNWAFGEADVVLSAALSERVDGLRTVYSVTGKVSVR